MDCTILCNVKFLNFLLLIFDSVFRFHFCFRDSISGFRIPCFSAAASCGRSCIIITKCYNSPSPILQSLESVTQAFSHTSPNFEAIIKIRSVKPHTLSLGFGEVPGNEYLLRPRYLQIPFYGWYLLGIATSMSCQPLFPDIYS